MNKLLFTPLFLALLVIPVQDGVALDSATTADRYTVSKINEQLYLLSGSLGHGPNVALSISESHALIVDGPRREAGRLDLMQKIRTITKLPIEYAVIPDGDYVLRDRSLFFDHLGAKVIAQENAAFGFTPSQIRFKNQLSLGLTSETIELHHISVNAHDDVIIHFPESNVIFVGNLYHANSLPAFFVGGIEGLQSAVELLDRLSDEHTVIVPRFGPAVPLAAVRQYLTDSKELVDQVHILHSSVATTDKIVVNSSFLDAVARFTGKSQPSAQRLSRLVERIVSTDLIRPHSVTDEKLDLYSGKYRSEDGGLIELVKQNEKLFARQLGGFLVELIPVDHRRFHIRGGLGDWLEFNFPSPTTGAIGLELFLYGQTVSAHRVN